MAEEQQIAAPARKPLEAVDTWEKLKVVLQARICHALNYITRFIAVLVIYGSAALTEYLLFLLIWLLLADEISAYPVVSAVYHYARIGLALGTILAALIHGAISTFDQIMMDIRLSRGGEA